MDVLCHEPEGPVTHHIWPFTFTPEATRILWEQASQFPILFGQRLSTPEDMLSYFITENLSGDAEATGLLWIMDDFKGMFYLEGITSTEATVHYAFFDRRHRGREPLVRAMVRMVFEKYKFNRLNAFIPAYVGSGPQRFVERCGFRIEGRKRNASWWKGKLFNSYCYGILPEDLDGRDN
jgi:hypothetical protein